MNVTVIIPVHNMADTLMNAVQSALAADKVILIDDGSTDNSAAIIKGAARAYTNVYSYATHTPMSAGVCYARNLAIAQADEDSLIIPLDADDMLLPNAIPTYAAGWQPGACVYAGWVEFDPMRDVAREVIPLPPEAIERQDIARGICFHRDSWLQAGGYNPLFNIGGEDYAFMLAMVRAGVTLIRLDEILYNYNTGGDTRSRAAHRRWPCINSLIEETYGQLSQNPAKAG